MSQTSGTAQRNSVYNYGANGYLQSLTNSLNQTVSFSRDALGRVLEQTLPDGRVISFSYDKNGNLTTVTPPGRPIHQMFFGVMNLMSEYLPPSLSIPRVNTVYSYNRDNQLTLVNRPDGELINYNYSPTRNLASINSSFGSNTFLYSSVTGQLTLAHSYDNVNLSYQYDGDLLKNVSWGGAVSGSYQRKYNSDLNLASESISNVTIGFLYDLDSLLAKAGDEVLTRHPQTGLITDTTLDGVTESFTYNSFGEVITESSSGLSFTYTRDDLGRITRKIENVLSSGNVQFDYSYDLAGQLIEVKKDGVTLNTYSYDSNSNRISKNSEISTVDMQDRLLTQGSLTFTYNANGDLTSVTPPSRPVHTFDFNLADLPAIYHPPTLSTATDTQIVYNLDRKPAQIIRPDGQTISVTYNDKVNASLFQGSNGDRRSFTYLQGRPVIASYGATGQTKRIDFDVRYLGNLVSGLNWRGNFNPFSASISIMYNPDFLPSHFQIGSIGVDLNYDQDFLLVGADSMVLNRDQNGLVTSSVYESINDAQSFNNFAEVVSYSAPGLSMTYQRDSLGRITNKTESFLNAPTISFDYEYDSSGRLIESRQNGAVVGSYTYDPNGNRILSNNTSAAYDNQDRLISYGSITYTFNVNGELESKQNLFTNEVTSYKHDTFGNLTQVTLPSGDVVRYLPDGFNRRTARYVNGVFDRGWIYFDPLHPMAEINSSGQIESVFIYATKSSVPDAMIKGGVKYRIISDHLGSPRLVINASSGALAQALQYDDWGNVTLDTNPGFQPFGFAGGLYDSTTKLVKFGARDYDPNTGSFLSKDPIGFASGDANMYRYVLNDPVNFTDPSGTVFVAVSGAGSAAGSFMATAGYEYGTVAAVSSVSGATATPYNATTFGYGAMLGGGAGGTASVSIGAGDVTDLNGNSYGISLALGPIGTFSITASSTLTLTGSYSNGVGLQAGFGFTSTHTTLGGACPK